MYTAKFLTNLAEIRDKHLFKQPPPAEDCPICFERMPCLETGSIYYACCGKKICCGCVHAPLYDDQGNEVDNEKCPFCRTPHPDTEEEQVKRTTKRAEANDAVALFNLGCDYQFGRYRLPQDYEMALELWHKAGHLGHAMAYCNIGHCYNRGLGVEVDEQKAVHYFELAAMRGDVYSRHNLGIIEATSGSLDRALNHYMIAARGGSDESLQEIRNLFSKELATKDDYATALQSYQAYLIEIKSDKRDEAAAAHEEYRYH